MDTTSSARAGTPARAVVSARGVDTHYLRAGAGKPVVLLADERDENRLHAALAALPALVVNARVIAPLIPLHVPFAEWLSDFLDGLGVHEVQLVADQPMASRALEFAAGDCVRVISVSLLIDGAVVPHDFV